MCVWWCMYAHICLIFRIIERPILGDNPKPQFPLFMKSITFHEKHLKREKHMKNT